MSSMMHIGNVRTTRSQSKVTKETKKRGAYQTVDNMFKGSQFVHVIELKNKGANPADVLKQLQTYAQSHRQGSGSATEGRLIPQ